MASYNISWKKSTKKDLRKIPKQEVIKIINAVMALSDNPKPSGSTKLTGSRFTYRIRGGNYRVIYDIHDKEIRIEVVKIGPRGDVYKP